MQRNWRSLIRPKRIEIDETSRSRFYGEFTCQPLERGFGITLGNAIRRVLLSSIQGAAIVSVKIDGVLHEFDTVPGIKEDVTDIIMNLKGVRGQAPSGRSQGRSDRKIGGRHHYGSRHHYGRQCRGPESRALHRDIIRRCDVQSRYVCKAWQRLRSG